MRTVPSNGLIIRPAGVESLQQVIDKGLWTPEAQFAVATEGQEQRAQWQAKLLREDGTAFAIYLDGEKVAEVNWESTGIHSVNNGLAAMIAARHVGVTPEIAAEALNQFAGVKRRMELLADKNGIKVYDDFAHHPTAIKTTLAGLRAKVGNEKIIAIIEPRSNTMRMGVHKDALNQSITDADDVLWFQPEGANWAMDDVVNKSPVPAKLYRDLDQLIEGALSLAEGNTHIVIMSNGGFGGVHDSLIEKI